MYDCLDAFTILPHLYRAVFASRDDSTRGESGESVDKLRVSMHRHDILAVESPKFDLEVVGSGSEAYGMVEDGE